MKKATIEQAVKEVLKKNTQGLTPKEITEKIISQKLYNFNTDKPESMVNHAIRKSCVGVNLKISKGEENKVFKLSGDGKYKLKES